MKARRIYFPALSLFVTFCAGLAPLFWFYVILASNIAPLPHPHWLTVCLQNSKTLGKACLAGMGIGILGSLLTLWLFLKTETPVTARFHLKNIIMGVLFGAGGGLLLGVFAMGIGFLQALHTPGGMNRLGGLEAFAGMALAGIVLLAVMFGAFCLIAMVIPYALFTLVSRARRPSPALPLAAAQPPHNSHENLHKTL